MEQATRELLEQSDDSEHAEWPRVFGRSALQARVVALKPVLDRIAGREFVLIDEIEDASYFAELAVQRLDPEARMIFPVFAVQFSNFGDLFTTGGNCEAEQLPEAVTAELVAATKRAGFRYVPWAALDEPYTGSHPAFTGAKWGTRFFDFL